MSITKLKLSKEISNKLEISLKDSKNFVDSFFKINKRFLKNNDVKISKFGSFRKKHSPERVGRNPKTLEEYIIPKQSKVSFTASKILKDLIN